MKCLKVGITRRSNEINDVKRGGVVKEQAQMKLHEYRPRHAPPRLREFSAFWVVLSKTASVLTLGSNNTYIEWTS